MYYIKARIVSTVSGRTIAELQVDVSPNSQDAEYIVERYSKGDSHIFSTALTDLQKRYGERFGISTGIVYLKEKF